MSTIEMGKKLLAEMANICLVTLREDGTPNMRTISAVKSDGYKTVWMLSGPQDRKAREIAHDPRCMIYATTLDDDAAYAEIRLWGTVEILSDPEAIDFVWNDLYDRYFPGGKNDPDVRVYKFTTTSGTVAAMGASGPETHDIPASLLA